MPPLELWAAGREESFPHPVLYYARADDPVVEAPAVALLELPRAAWASLPLETRAEDDPCWTAQEVSLPDGRATLLSGYSWEPAFGPPKAADDCPTGRPHDRFLAHAYLGETVVVVPEDGWPNPTREGVEAIVRALRPREPATAPAGRVLLAGAALGGSRWSSAPTGAGAAALGVTASRPRPPGRRRP